MGEGMVAMDRRQNGSTGNAFCTFVYPGARAPTKTQREEKNTEDTVLNKLIQSVLSRIRVFVLGLTKRGKLEPCDLPPIQILVGRPHDDDDNEDDDNVNDDVGPWYYSLNNRRLWVLKQCHKEGLLDNERYNNLIAARVRRPKSVDEVKRYSIANCALEAKLTRTGDGGGGSAKKGKQKGRIKKKYNNKEIQTDHSDSSDVGSAIMDDGLAISRDAAVGERHGVDNMDTINSYNADSDSESDDGFAYKNPFCALL
jgi:hypothetical protein